MDTSARTARQEHHLLETEVDAVFGLDYHIATDHIDHNVATLKQQDVHAVVAWSPQARFIAVSEAVISYKTALDTNLDKEVYEPGRTPAALTQLCDSLGVSQDSITGGPSFTFPNECKPPQQLGDAALLIITSSTDTDIRGISRPLSWEQDEWSKLLSGNHGPWAAAVTTNIRTRSNSDNGGSDTPEVVSICFSARRSATAAEAGVWTHEAHRGRGLASAVVAAWAELERQHKQILYYSLSGVNPASGGVARKLGLLPLGWIWKISR